MESTQAKKTSIPITSHSSSEVAIINAALQLFSERGFDGVSMRQVAEMAGVSKANIYHHFESKQALYIAVLRSSVTETHKILEPLADSTESFESRLKRFMTAHLSQIFKHSMNSRLILREAMDQDEGQAKTMADKVVGENFRLLIALLREAQTAGVIKPETDPVLCATLLVGSNVFFFQAQNVMKHISEVTFVDDLEVYSNGIVDMVLNGILEQADNNRAGK